MYKFSYYLKDKNKRAMRITLTGFSRLLQIAGLTFVIAMFFLLVGIFDDPEALSYAIPWSIAFAVALIIPLIGYFKTKKIIEKTFSSLNSDVINYTLEKNGLDYKISWGEDNKYFSNFNENDIQYVVFRKKYIGIHLKNRTALDFDNTEEIFQLFKSHHKKYKNQ